MARTASFMLASQTASERILGVPYNWSDYAYGVERREFPPAKQAGPEDARWFK